MLNLLTLHELNILIMNELKQLGVIPFDFNTLISVLGDYKSPKDKVLRLLENKDIIRLKKGMYVVSPQIHNQTLSTELVANLLYGPSYISFESALSYYGIIPERVYTVKSATLKRSRNFSNSLGYFEYTQMEASYFSIGVTTKIINSQYAYLIASQEKALCDLIIATKGLRLQSLKSVKTFLEEDIRADFSLLDSLNWNIVKECMDTTQKKKKELMLLYNLFQK